MRGRCVILTVFFLLFHQAGHAQGKTEAPLNRLSAALIAAMDAHDAAKAAAFYTDDAVLMSPPLEPAIRGRAGIETYYKRMASSSLISINFTPDESAVARSQGFEAGTTTIISQVVEHTIGSSGVSSSRVFSQTFSYRYLRVFKRVRGAWKIAYENVNYRRPCAAVLTPPNRDMPYPPYPPYPPIS